MHRVLPGQRCGTVDSGQAGKGKMVPDLSECDLTAEGKEATLTLSLMIFRDNLQ